jgi:DNA-binding transcriptional LysR family regulator
VDKFRALEYFVATAHEGSFSGAARVLDVSVPAVAKLVTALERELEVRLFDRTSQGMSLTAAGAGYLEECLPALNQLHEAGERTKGAAKRSKGTVVVGVQHVIASACLNAALPRFHARYPEIELDIRDFQRATEETISGVDVMLMLGWPKVPDLVHRRIGAGRFIVVASPSYWAAHGIPQRPKDLERHVCLPIRAVDGTIMDLWTFLRDGVEESALARGWLTTSNAHRDMVVDMAIAGEGVVRMVDWMNLPDQRAGRLVRALADWVSPEAPPVNLMFRPSVRRVPRVNAFVEFATELFRDLDAGREERVLPTEKPVWLRRHYGRASAARTK